MKRRLRLYIVGIVLFAYFISISNAFSYLVIGDNSSIIPLEKRIYEVLKEHNLSERILNIEALSFKDKVIVGISFFYGLLYVKDQSYIYQDLMDYTERLTKVVFHSFPNVSELDLSGIFKYNHNTEKQYEEPTFTTSITRKDFERLYSEDIPFDLFLDRTGRVYYSDALLLDDISSLKSESYIEENSNREKAPQKKGLFAKLREFWAILRRVNKGGIYKNAVWRGNPHLKEIAITFDDGPRPVYTPIILDILNRYSVKATFFIIGKRALIYHYFVRDMLSSGHTVGNHTMHHLNLTLLSYDKKRDEILDAQSVIYTLTGSKCRYFRPPGGDYDWEVEKIANDNSLLLVLWTKKLGDYLIPQEEANILLKKVKADVVPGAIIVFHLGVKSTIEILPEFLDYVKKKGYRIVPLEKLIEDAR
ncbi:polysaccharide deacetylase family protein [bacterium]|nr:polysaccharide deacetylase family protein [bacterium]